MTRSSELRLPVRLCATATAFVLLTCLFTLTRADEPLPNVAASLGLKILSLQKQFAAKSDGITIFVLGDSNVAKAFQSYLNQNVGTMRVAKVLVRRRAAGGQARHSLYRRQEQGSGSDQVHPGQWRLEHGPNREIDSSRSDTDCVPGRGRKAGDHFEHVRSALGGS